MKPVSPEHIHEHQIKQIHSVKGCQRINLISKMFVSLNNLRRKPRDTILTYVILKKIEEVKTQDGSTN